MARRAKVPTGDLFLTTNGVVTRLAMRELKSAKIDPGSLLAKAGISQLKLGEEPKRVSAVSQILRLFGQVQRHYRYSGFSNRIALRRS